MFDISLWSIIKWTIVILVLISVYRKISKIRTENMRNRAYIRNEGNYRTDADRKEAANKDRIHATFSNAIDKSTGVMNNVLGPSTAMEGGDYEESMFDVLSKCKTGCKTKKSTKSKSKAKPKKTTKSKSKKGKK